jgi:hypothetical protein
LEGARRVGVTSGFRSLASLRQLGHHIRPGAFPAATEVLLSLASNRVLVRSSSYQLLFSILFSVQISLVALAADPAADSQLCLVPWPKG